MTKLIRVQGNTYEQLQKLSGKLQARHGTRFSLDKTIQFLLDEKNPRKTAQNPIKGQSQDEPEESPDSVKWFSLHHRQFKAEKAPISSTKIEQK